MQNAPFVSPTTALVPTMLFVGKVSSEVAGEPPHGSTVISPVPDGSTATMLMWIQSAPAGMPALPAAVIVTGTFALSRVLTPWPMRLSTRRSGRVGVNPPLTEDGPLIQAAVVAPEPDGATGVVEDWPFHGEATSVLHPSTALTAGYGLTEVPPFGWISKCRWGPEALPVMPTKPSNWPAVTVAP